MKEPINVIDLAIQQIEDLKFGKNEFGKTMSQPSKVGLTHALNHLQYIRETQYYKCDCGHEVQHQYVHTNEDGNTTCSLCLIENLKQSNTKQN
jgi:hypothetical protein